MTDPTFLNRPNSSYLPLRDKFPIATTRLIGKTGRQNKQEFFFLTKPHTIREKATIDLIFPTPSWLQADLDGKFKKQIFTRITVTGDTRIIDGGLIRITG
jgi:hypothetical protein